MICCKELNGQHAVFHVEGCIWADSVSTLRFNGTLNRWELLFYGNNDVVIATYAISASAWNCCGSNVLSLVSHVCRTAPSTITLHPTAICCSSSSSSSSLSSSSASQCICVTDCDQCSTPMPYQWTFTASNFTGSLSVFNGTWTLTHATGCNWGYIQGSISVILAYGLTPEGRGPGWYLLFDNIDTGAYATYCFGNTCPCSSSSSAFSCSSCTPIPTFGADAGQVGSSFNFGPVSAIVGDVLVMVTAFIEDTQQVSGVTWGGGATWSRAFRVTQTGLALEAWYAPVTTAGTNNIIISWSGSVHHCSEIDVVSSSNVFIGTSSITNSGNTSPATTGNLVETNSCNCVLTAIVTKGTINSGCGPLDCIHTIGGIDYHINVKTGTGPDHFITGGPGTYADSCTYATSQIWCAGVMSLEYNC